MVDAAPAGLRPRGVLTAPRTDSRLPRPAEPGALARPAWFGGQARPLFGWWHVPQLRSATSARAVVVMAPALARERLSADYSWRLLAEAIAELGFAVLRFDFSSTGDSAGAASDHDLVGCWKRDIVTALDTARTATAGPVVLLGHRVGGTLAADAARAGNPIDALVLWDPVLRGKRYLRELRAQQLLAVPGAEMDPASCWADVPGEDLSTETAAGIATLNLLSGPAPDAWTAQTLVLARAGAGAENTFQPLLDRLPDATLISTDGQAELLNLDPIAAVPAYDAVGQIVGWLDSAFDDTTHPVEVSGPTATATLAVSAGGSSEAGPNRPVSSIVERAGYFCAGRIFGIVSEPASFEPGSPEPETVLLLSAGLEVHTGPGRLWVDLARGWAARGLRVVRCDFPGLGESAAAPGAAPRSVYEASAIDDVVALVRELDPEDPGSVVLLGMCSGAYNGLEAVARLKTRRLIALAFGWWLVPAEFRRDERTDPRRALYRSGLSALRLLVAGSAGRRFLQKHPERLWLVGSRARLASPLRPFRKVVDAGTDVTMVLGPSDLEHFTQQPGRLDRLLTRPGFALEFVPGLDHGLLSGDPRRRARQFLVDHLAGTAAASVPPPRPVASELSSLASR